jgi:hypothetical protein
MIKDSEVLVLLQGEGGPARDEEEDKSNDGSFWIQM